MRLLPRYVCGAEKVQHHGQPGAAAIQRDAGTCPAFIPLPTQTPAPEPTILIEMAKKTVETFEVACPDCGAMIKIDAANGLVISHTPAPRKRMFEDLETAAKAMRDHEERKESIFRQSVDAERNKADLLEKKFAEALKKAKDAPDVKPLREFDLD